MPAKYLVEFLAQWIRDEELRRKVLHREKTELKNWGLTQLQLDDLVSLDVNRIMDRLQDELKTDFKIDLAGILNDFVNTGVPGGGGGAAGAVYDEGRPHVRGVDPQKITHATASVVIVRGHGYDNSVQMLFVPSGGGAPVPGAVLDLDADVDVWQRATVKVTLPSTGKWRVMARIPATPTTVEIDSKENVQLDVA